MERVLRMDKLLDEMFEDQKRKKEHQRRRKGGQQQPKQVEQEQQQEQQQQQQQQQPSSEGKKRTGYRTNWLKNKVELSLLGGEGGAILHSLHSFLPSRGPPLSPSSLSCASVAFVLFLAEEEEERSGNLVKDMGSIVETVARAKREGCGCAREEKGEKTRKRRMSSAENTRRMR